VSRPPGILAIHGSPRSGGNTDRLLGAFLAGLDPGGENTVRLRLDDLDIAPCRHCGGCLDTARCVRRDDMDRVLGLLAETRFLAFSSPVYFLGLTAQAKIMIDRCQPLWVAKYRLGRPLSPVWRPAVFVSTAGQRVKDIFGCPLKVARAFFATAQFRLADSIVEPGLDEEGSGPDERALARARSRGESLRGDSGI
jgi:NAD(P)H-dependent FMN reductase